MHQYVNILLVHTDLSSECEEIMNKNQRSPKTGLKKRGKCSVFKLSAVDVMDGFVDCSESRQEAETTQSTDKATDT